MKPIIGNTRMGGGKTLSYLLVAAVFALATSGAWAANATWKGGSGGTEETPIDIYDATKWNPEGLPTTYGNITFEVDAPTVLTNTCPVGTKICTGFMQPNSGDFTFLGPITFHRFVGGTAASKKVTVVKKGDWDFNGFWVGNANYVDIAFTNVSGKLEQTSNGYFRIANGNTSTGIVENVSGDWTVASDFQVAGGGNARGELYWRNGKLEVKNSKVFYLAAANATTGILEIDDGEWTLSGYLAIASGQNSSARFKHNGGTLTVNGSDIRFGNNANSTTGSAYLEIGGGTVAAKLIKHGAGATPATMTFNGGTFKALAAGTVISNSTYLTVNVTSSGGTIDANGKAVAIEEVLEDASGETGTMTYKGRGSVTLAAAPTYTGVTTVEVGTALVVLSAIAGNKLAFTIPEGLADGVYPVVAISGSGTFAANVLDDVAKPADANASFVLSGDNKRIYCLYGIDAAAHIYMGPVDGNLSTGDNWLSGTVPTSGNAYISCASDATLTVGATFAPDTLTIPETSAVVTIGAGDLTVSTLTNAQRLAVASGASLTVTGDIVSHVETYLTGHGYLYSNEGTVTVGRAVGLSTADRSYYYEYEKVTENTQPMRIGALVFDNPGKHNNFYMRLHSNSAVGKWVVGEGGLSFATTIDSGNTKFYVEGVNATLYSSADWTLANSGKNSTTSDLYVRSNGSLTIDTSDYDVPTTPRTVTLNGRIDSAGNTTIAGCGKVVVDTTGSHASLSEDNANTRVASGKTIAVTDTATLQINAGRKITGNGTVSLAAGTTLVLPSDMVGANTPCIPGLTLPAEGTATLRIDGARLRSGEYTLLNDVPANYANLAVDGTALDNHKVELFDDGENLKLRIIPNGLIILIR